jgi:hypothetical protein
MLASITPLGERGRHSRWGITVTAFALGATAAAAALGALVATGGGLIFGSPTHGRLLALTGLLALALVLDLAPPRIPGPIRQVNERWLDEFRGWVYGAGFGAQLGLGVTTVVSSAATYVAIAAAFLTASPGRGALVLGAFGLVRGLTPLAAARVRRPDQLLALHTGLERWRGPVALTGSASLAALVLLAVVGSMA